MKNVMIGASALALISGAALAGGLDRSGQSILPVFSDKNTASLSFGLVKPSVTGTDALGNTYDVGDQYNQATLAYTGGFGDGFNFSVIYDQPYGANVTYNNDPATSTLGGTSADLDSKALSIVGRYQIGDRFSVFGGVKRERVTADVVLNGLAYGNAIVPQGVTPVATAGATQPVIDGTVAAYNAATGGFGLPPINSDAVADALAGNTAALSALVDPFTGATGQSSGALAATAQATIDGIVDGAVQSALAGFLTAGGGYQFNMSDSDATGYLVGAAYEIPDIALRVVGTYHFETNHSATTTETLLGNSTPGTVDFVTPASFNLEAQTGIAPGTLLTFGYRWTEFSKVDLVPTLLGNDLVDLDDSRRYTLGIGRQFSDKFAGSMQLSFEPTGDGGTVSPLGPTDGLFGISLGGRYQHDNFTMSGGINYSWLGDADAGVGGVSVASFEDNHVIGVGFKAEMKF